MEETSEKQYSNQRLTSSVVPILEEQKWIGDDFCFSGEACFGFNHPCYIAVSCDPKIQPFIETVIVDTPTLTPRNWCSSSYVQFFSLNNFRGPMLKKLKESGYKNEDLFVSVQYKAGAQNEEFTTTILCNDLALRGIVKSDKENSNEKYVDIESYSLDKNKYTILQYWKPYRSFVFITQDVNMISEFLSVFSNRQLISDFVARKMMDYAGMRTIDMNDFAVTSNRPIPLIKKKTIEKVYSQPVTANVDNETSDNAFQIKTQDGFFYEQAPFPAKDDPYQSKPTVLLLDLLNNIFDGEKDEIEFYKSEFINIKEKLRNNNMQEMGNFIIDYNFRLGYGDRGSVWLAQHVPSNIFVATKIVSPQDPINYSDVLTLQKLKRLYGLFKAHTPQNLEKTFIFMPLANGIPSTVLKYSETFPVKATVQDGILRIKNLEIALNLIKSFIKEIEYFAKSGYYQIDQQVAQVYACNDFQSVCIIDYDGEQRTQPIPETEWFIDPLRWSIINFLGIHEDGVFESSTLLPSDKISQLRQPDHLIAFLKAVDNNKEGPYSLAQLKVDFENLKSGL